MTKSPCFSCQERFPGCHAICVIGREYWKKEQERNERIKKAKAIDNEMLKVKIEGIRSGPGPNHGRARRAK